jgi:TPR repeat protein
MKKQLSRITMMFALALVMGVYAMPAVAQKVSKKAEKYYKKAEEAGSKSDYKGMVKWTTKAAKKGHPEALTYMGKFYLDGYFVEPNSEKVFEWWNKGAELGFANLQYLVGTLYSDGFGVKEDMTKAVEWWTKAAEQDHGMAQNNLGVCYEYGEGVTQNYAEAIKWYRKAAEQDYAQAQHNLGVCYYKGYGVPQNYAEAVKWIRKAAQQGLAEAQYTLGWCYERGEGVSKSITEAVTWYRKAAEQGHAEAEKRLNECTKTQDDILDLTGVSIAATTYIGDGEGGINIDDLKAAEPTGGHTTDDAPQEQEEVLDNAVVEVGATYPGGEVAILSHIAKNIRYPESAIECELEGVVTLRFKVGKDGHVSNVSVVGSMVPQIDKNKLVTDIMLRENVDKQEATIRANRKITRLTEAGISCDREAVRVIKTLQRFTPARQKGHPVAVWFTIPIRYQIQ